MCTNVKELFVLFIGGVVTAPTHKPTFFLFRILYTGDFRFEESERTPNPLPMLKSLHNQLGEPLEIGRTPNPLPMLKSLHNQLGEPLEIGMTPIPIPLPIL